MNAELGAQLRHCLAYRAGPEIDAGVLDAHTHNFDAI
jgi:hypothetical protein